MTASLQTDTVESSTVATWTIKPKSLFSRNFDLFHADAFITTLQMSFWSEGATFQIAGHEFEIRRTSLWRDGFQLVAENEIVCDVKSRFWPRRFDLNTANWQWLLSRVGWLSADYQLTSGESRHGTISRVGWWSRQRIAQFGHDVPPPVQVLAIFLVLVIARRQAKSD